MSKAYLQISMQIDAADRANAAGVYNKYKAAFLDNVQGAKAKELLIREEDVQVLHEFDTVENASAYLQTELFNQDVVTALKPYLKANPDVRIYTVA
ncbi:hypothetical protein [Chitinophaga pinensis]|uniref:Uncharacterized protein n=1 Tax=Chitinophaga pinensis (strain ATCC 43595 / DSM 2588 / LMG 13176 / NBRC 15968 / NCIMB 11800 / UQM 2034) TaxID=485918 RepID=A0A979G9U6_CHIPD|nr:hypothetical protein [Chitinophaga pinensis]ACU63388.1 conserved hypothetical protein [Chitinophaga pinensis DSM 2588]